MMNNAQQPARCLIRNHPTSRGNTAGHGNTERLGRGSGGGGGEAKGMGINYDQFTNCLSHWPFNDETSQSSQEQKHIHKPSLSLCEH